MDRLTVIRCVNLAYHLDGDHELVRSAADGTDVLVFVECRDRDNQPVHVARILGPDWQVWQDTSSGSRAGTAIAVRRASGTTPRRSQRARDRARTSRLLRLSRPGRAVQARYLRVVRLRDPLGRPLVVAGAHLPLRTTGQQGTALRALARWWRLPTRSRRVVLGDGNMPHHSVRTALRAPHSDGADVMFAVWSTGWSNAIVRDYKAAGTDHHILTFRSS